MDVGDKGKNVRRWAAVARMHQSLFTGLLLRVLLENGAEAAAVFLNRTFHWQHDEKFLPALKSLGLDEQPDAVACAKFFYLANLVGGVDVQCMVESDRKAWIRYPPPRWAYMDASICAVPNEVTIAMMRGFHARCGDSLGNPRLGFVCTKMTSNGDPGLEGYFIEEDRELAPDEKLRFASGEDGPRFDPALAPQVDWDETRGVKAKRNYGLAYIKQMLPAMRFAAGDEDGAAISGQAAKLVGLQLYKETRTLLGRAQDQRGAGDFADYLVEMLAGCGDEVSLDRDEQHHVVTQKGWRLMAGSSRQSPADFDAWAQLWQGACAAHDNSLTLSVSPAEGKQSATEPATYIWSIGAR